MNILQLVPKLDIGGVEKGTVEVARYLASHGHKAVVVSGGGKLVKSLAAAGARHYELPIGRKNPAVMIWCYYRLKNIIIKENIDIVHARSRVPALVSYFAARKTGRVFLTTAHGQYRKHWISRVMGWGKLVIAVSLAMARHMHDNFGVPLRKIRIIPRGVDLDKFSYIAPSERKGPTFKIGMICRFTPLKGHLDFLKAASLVSRSMPNTEFILMGNVSTAKAEYMKKIELAIRQYSLQNRVRFIDSDQSVTDVMAELNVVVSANRQQEAFGRTVIEAQARGACVVATDVGGVAENVIHGETGLLSQSGDPADMADKILHYARDRSFMESVAEKARRKVEKDFSLEKLMAMTLEVYEEALGISSILVIKVSSLGDVVLAVPSLRAIRKRYKKAHIRLLIDARFRELFINCPYIDEITSCDLKGRDRNLGFLKLASRIRSEDFDISIDLQNNRKSHLLSFLSGIPERYGYDNGKLSFLINRKIKLPKQKIGPIEHQGRVLRLAGVTNVEEKLELWPSAEAEKWAEDFLTSNWLKKGQELIGLNLSASEKWKSKNWPLKYMEKLASEAERKRSARVVLLGTGKDRKAADRFKRSSKTKPIDCVGKTDLLKLVEMIKRCDVLLTGDSAPMHIAASCNTPVVALFGPTDPGRHAPPADEVFILTSKVRCMPCYRPVCPKGHERCMKEIRPEDVFRAIEKVLEKKSVK